MNESIPGTNQSNRLKTIKRLSSGIALVLVTALTISLINRTNTVPAQIQAKPYDGMTLYKGLFFGSGPVASKVPSIKKASPYMPAEYKALEGQVTRYIQTKDPGFFERFGKEIQSGDRARVAAVIKSTNLLQKEALLEVTKNSKTQFATQVRKLNNPKSMRRSAEPDEPENDANVAVEVVVWVALFVVIVVWLVAQKSPAELKGLKYEQYVDEVVRAVPKADMRTTMP